MKVSKYQRLQGWGVWLFALALAFLSADIVSSYLRLGFVPREQRAPISSAHLQPQVPPVSTSIIVARNIFGHMPPKLFQEGEATDDAPNNEPEPSTLSFLELLGTIVHYNPRMSLATIRMGNVNKTQAFKVDGMVQNLARVVSIERRRVVYRNLQNQRLEFLIIPESFKDIGMLTGANTAPVNMAPQSKPQEEIQKTGENSFALKRDVLQKYTSNLSDVLRQARVFPVTGPDGGILGFRFASIRPDSIYEKLGFRVGDVLQSVNGQKIQSPEQAMELYRALRTSDKVAIGIERDGGTQEINYSITN